MALGGVLRIDTGTLRPPKEMSDGRLRADAYITRAGIFEYMDGDGKIRREYRPPEEVFHPDSMASFGLVPVTNDHPDVGLLNSKNSRDYMVGATGENIRRDGNHLAAEVMVSDADTIKQMKKGKQEVSCGYTCDVDETPGHHPTHGRYDAIQRNIRGNHVAIVGNARAGKTARVRMDSMTGAQFAVMIRTDKVSAARGQQGENMDPEKLQETIRALGAQLTEAKERADEANDKLKEAQTRADVAEGKLLVTETRVSELQSALAARVDATETEQVKTLKTKLDSAEAQIARFDATIEKRVRERAKLERQAFVILGDSERLDDMNDRQVMTAVVKRLDANADVGASVPDGIIQGRFLALVDGYQRNAQAQARVAQIIVDNSQTETRTDSNEEKKRKLRDQWKQPLPNDPRARKEA